MSLKRMLLTLTGIVAVYGCVCGLVAWQQTSLIFFPIRELRLTPKDYGMEYQDWNLASSDEAKIHAWSMPPRQGKRWVLHCHGNGGNISHRLEQAKRLHEKGLGVVLFDYRGYGRSSGKLWREEQLIEDAQVVYQELQRRVQDAQIIVHGESLGGGVAAALAERNPYHALILESTFTSLAERAREAYPWLPIRQLSRFQLDTLSRLKNLHGPILVMHGRHDEVIGFHHGEKLFAAAPEPKIWIELAGGHNEFDAPAWSEGIRKLLVQLEAEAKIN